MKKEFYYPSADGETQIHAVEWIPKGEVRAILQISHGMVEYIDRYDEFVSWLTEKGWYVTGNDHWDMENPFLRKKNMDFSMKQMGTVV